MKKNKKWAITDTDPRIENQNLNYSLLLIRFCWAYIETINLSNTKAVECDYIDWKYELTNPWERKRFRSCKQHKCDFEFLSWVIAITAQVEKLVLGRYAWAIWAWNKWKRTTS